MRPGARHRDIRVTVSRFAPPGAKQASMSSRLRATEDLGGEQSPWKNRTLLDLQWSGNVTDSSVEQSLEVGHSSEDDRVGDDPDVFEADRGSGPRGSPGTSPAEVGSHLGGGRRIIG